MNQIKEGLKQRFPHLYYLYRRFFREHLDAVKERKAVQDWKRGKLKYPPSSVKYGVIKEYARRYNLKVLIETGTFQGDTILAVRRNFEKIFSIELSEKFYRLSKAKLGKFSNVKLVRGDSSEKLKSILKSLKVPALFWLDAHYSAGETARGSIDSPIVQELNLIVKNPVRGHVILIDDAEDYINQPGYISTEELKIMVGRYMKDYKLEIKDNIVRIYPGKVE